MQGVVLEAGLISIPGRRRIDDEEVVVHEFAHHDIVVILVDLDTQGQTLVLHVFESLALQDEVDLVVVHVDDMGVVSPDQHHLIAQLYEWGVTYIAQSS